jgi:hypothetical protein
VLVSLHAHLDTLELDLDAKDVNHHALNVQTHQASVLTVWIHSFSDQTVENANKAHHVIMVKYKLLENAQGFVIMAFISITEPVSSEDALADSKTTDLVDALVHQSSLEDVNHQPSG